MMLISGVTRLFARMRPSSKGDETLLLYRACKGDEAAFGALSQLHDEALAAFCFGLCKGSCVDPEEVAQETRIKAFRSLDKFRGDSAYRSWLFSVAYNVFRDQLRAMKNTVPWEAAALDRQEAVRRTSALRVGLATRMSIATVFELLPACALKQQFRMGYTRNRCSSMNIRLLTDLCIQPTWSIEFTLSGDHAAPPLQQVGDEPLP